MFRCYCAFYSGRLFKIERKVIMNIAEKIRKTCSDCSFCRKREFYGDDKETVNPEWWHCCKGIKRRNYSLRCDGAVLHDCGRHIERERNIILGH